jgi:hypothetical protein
MLSARIRSLKWGDLLRPFDPTTKEHDKKEDGEPTEVVPMFDKKYKTILKMKYIPSYSEILSWVNANSIGSVDVRLSMNVIYIAFENSDDATFFSIKYSV